MEVHALEVSVLDTFQDLGRDLFLTGLASSQGGTLSTRDESHALITRRGTQLAHIRADDLIDLRLEGDPPGDAPDDASIHQAIYRATDAQAVVYARPPYTMSLALVEDRLSPANNEGAEMLGSAPVLITQRALTSPDVTQLIGRILKENRVVALRGHGVFTRGEDLPDAMRVLTLLEEMCKVAHLYRVLVGEEPQPFVRDRQPANIGPSKNGGQLGPRRAPPRPGPRPPSGGNGGGNTGGGGGGNWRREEGPPRREPRQPTEQRPPGGGRRGGAPHR